MAESSIYNGIVQLENALRLDVYLADVIGLLSRSQLKLRLQEARVNGRPVKLSRKVENGDSYEVILVAEPDTTLVAEQLPLEIIFENDSVIVVNKAQGMVTHPAHGNWQGTLANALLGRYGSAEQTAAPRAGIVHRLDKDTSGLIIAARNASAQEYLSAQFRNRSTIKYYLAIVCGRPSPEVGQVNDWLARDPKERKRFAPSAEGVGKRALTDYQVLSTGTHFSLLLLRPRTGRTHQLRVHCRKLGCPILGDPIYNSPVKQFPGATLMLHAAQLTIRLPDEEAPRCFNAPLPLHFSHALQRFQLLEPVFPISDS